jgi:hypothetical protein
MHDSQVSLYWEYVAFCESRLEVPASLSTFSRVFTKVFPSCLQFRKQSQHKCCTICAGLKESIRLEPSPLAKEQLWTRYLHHVSAQWRDRLALWSLCELSRSRFIGNNMASGSVGSSIACICMDGVDQSKFRVPRIQTSGKVPHAVAKLHRPTLHVAAAWVVGDSLDLYVSDENLKKDSDTQMEMLALDMNNHVCHTYFLLLLSNNFCVGPPCDI